MKWVLPFVPFVLSALAYDVHFVGMENADCLKALKNVSDLVNLQERPPASINGLRFRIDSDLPALMKVLRAYAYYDASITYDIEPEQTVVDITIYIHPGQQYRIGSYEVYHGACLEPASVAGCVPFSPEKLGLEIEKPALSVNIVNAELQLLTELSRCGYPLASIEKRKVEVDMATKEVSAAVCVDEGPFTKFGPIMIFGLRNIHPRYIERRVTWKEGETYDSDLVDETQKKILRTDLFSSVLISHGDEVDQIGELPMKMRLTEARHRQISAGIFYATVEGPGVSFGWTHRNVRGMGEVVTIKGDFSKWYLMGELSYKKPDFLTVDQSYRALAALNRENINPYIAFTYRFANYIERKMDPQRTLSVGLKLEHIIVSKSATNGSYLLVGLPVFAKYDTSDSSLDPTRGMTFVYQVTPYQSLDHGDQQFVKQRLTGTFYIPTTEKKWLIIAIRGQLGSIAGAKRENVPLPKLFLGGSEDDLRGYKYMTVSPLNDDHKPLGGRAAIFASVETRFRVSKTIGIVPFADFGTVTSDELPEFTAKWFKSVGLGLRYYAFFGPLRFDVGFPLDRRKMDPFYRIYASVGQTF
jgi:translocation and assembly module TamA